MSRTPIGEILREVNDATGATTRLVDGKGRALDDVFIPSAQAVALGSTLTQSGLGYGRHVFTKWRKAVGDAMAGIADARIAFIGDSLSAGLTTPIGDARRSLATPAMVARLMAARGLPINEMVMFGEGSRTASNASIYDPRITAPGAWASGTALFSLGGSFFTNGTDLAVLSFAPGAATANQFNQFEVWYVQNPGYGSLDVKVDGVSVGTINCAGTRALGRQTFSTTLGNHTVTLTPTGTGSTLLVIGVCARNTAIKAIEVYNVSVGGSKATDWTGNVGDWTAGPAVDALAPHLTIIDLTINDRKVTTDTASAVSALQARITNAKSYGDVLLCVPVATALTGAAPFTAADNQARFDDALRALAAANGVPIWSKRDRLGTYEEANPLGYYSDTFHLSRAGYSALALDLCDLILS